MMLNQLGIMLLLKRSEAEASSNLLGEKHLIFLFLFLRLIKNELIVNTSHNSAFFLL